MTKQQRRGVSPWAVHLANQLADQQVSILAEEQVSSKEVQVVLTDDALVVVVSPMAGAKLVLRAAFTPASDLEVADSNALGKTLDYTLTSSLGTYRVAIQLEDGDPFAGVRYETRFTPVEDLTIPFWPKDVLALDEDGAPAGGDIQVHAAQEGLRSGLVYANAPADAR